MPDDIIDEQAVEKAVLMFDEAGLDAKTALLASARLFTMQLNRFKAEAPRIRAELGEENTRRFATEHLNEVIYDIQDSVPVAVRLFNALMRDPTDEKGAPE